MNAKVFKTTVVATVCAAIFSFAPVFSETEDERWTAIKNGLYENAKLLDGKDVFTLTSVKRASSGSHVPVGVSVPSGRASAEIESITLIIDNNPAPVSAEISANDFSKGLIFSTVVRIEEYTPVRAVAKTKDGKYYMNSIFVKASGGCSGTLHDTTNLAFGNSKLELKNAPNSKGALARFQIEHPNFSGLQFDEISRHYIPADFILKYRVEIDGEAYFNLDSSIALSTNPYFEINIPNKNFDSIRLTMVDMKNKTYTGNWDGNGLAIAD